MTISRVPLSDLILEVDVRNRDLKYDNLLGVTISKKFIASVANVIGTDLSNYKIISSNQFACSLMQVSRDGGIAVSLYKGEKEAIMSPAYYIFTVKGDRVLPDYLDLVFRNKEFDREAVFLAVGGVRGTLTWEEFQSMRIKLPSISKQKEILQKYAAIEKRNEMLFEICSKITQEGSLIFRNMLKNNTSEYLFGDVVSLLKDGTHNPPSRVDNGIPLIAGQTIENGFISYEKMTYISEDDYKIIHNKYHPIEFDLVMTKIGTVGKVGLLRKKDIPIAIHCNSALIRFKENIIDQLTAYWLLTSTNFQNSLKEQMISSVQDFLSLSQIANIKVQIPFKEQNKKQFCLLGKFTKLLSSYQDEIEINKKIQNLLLLALN